ncbi:SulP family inorganic anion transporter [Haloglycomyces albus]|uniref:SulP family inorganic anion transporter n=1 Tax=Haloglycomyces albus TaxID=526067 RepID=UPI0004BA10BA|nr:SulP family inorganic anion transporter [Haloglycomyces albus]
MTILARLKRFALPKPSFAFLRIELLAGLLVALSMIPTSIAFSIVVGVDPSVGLFASAVMACSIAAFGGRPAMVSIATAAMALILAPLGHTYGAGYVMAATIAAGVVQILLATTGVTKLMRYIPRSVFTGFTNALAILIFLSQMPYLIGQPWPVWALAAAALGIIVLFPYLTKVIPAPLVAIVVLTTVTVVFTVSVPTVGSMGNLPDGLPWVALPDVPFTLDTVRIIAPYAVGLAIVGLLESLMAAGLVDDMTDTESNKTREAAGQGAGNIMVGIFGGFASCAAIGQTVMNVKSGARSRLSTFSAGIFLLILVVALGDVVGHIPMAVLVAIMVFVAAITFDWHSVRPSTLKRLPISETVTMASTVVATVTTHNLAIGVGVGVIVAMIIFARKAAKVVNVTSVTDPDGCTEFYAVSGELFFASTNQLIESFDYQCAAETVIVDLTEAHVWDASAVAALDAVTDKYRRRGKDVDIIGFNAPSKQLHDNLSTRPRQDA